MKEWLLEHRHIGEIDDQSRKKIIHPNEGIRAQKIEKKEATVQLDTLSIIEQYALAIGHFLDEGISFVNDALNIAINESLIRLVGMTQSGKVWLRNEIPVTLNINEWTADAKNSFLLFVEKGEINRIIRLLFLNMESPKGTWERMTPYLVRKDCISPITMDQGLITICEFLSDVSLSKRTTLRVSGWNVHDLDRPNEIIQMLACSYEQIVLDVRPSNGRVQYIHLA